MYCSTESLVKSKKALDKIPIIKRRSGEHPCSALIHPDRYVCNSSSTLKEEWLLRIRLKMYRHQARIHHYGREKKDAVAKVLKIAATACITPAYGANCGTL